MLQLAYLVDRALQMWDEIMVYIMIVIAIFVMMIMILEILMVIFPDRMKTYYIKPSS